MGDDTTFADRMGVLWDILEDTLKPRKRLDLSNAFVAERLARRGVQIDQSQLSKWRHGVLTRDLHKLVALCKLTGDPPLVDPGWLVFGKETKAPPPHDLPVKYALPAQRKQRQEDG